MDTRELEQNSESFREEKKLLRSIAASKRKLSQHVAIKIQAMVDSVAASSFTQSEKNYEYAKLVFIFSLADSVEFSQLTAEDDITLIKMLTD